MIELVRFSEVPQQGILGRFTLPNGVKYYSIEKNWEGNARRISCVPEGSYRLYLRNSPRFGPSAHLYNPIHEVYLTAEDIPGVMNKESRGRSHVLIHAANLAEQLQGCIALGMSKGHLYSNTLKQRCQAILTSKAAVEGFNEWFRSLRNQTEILTIRRAKNEEVT